MEPDYTEEVQEEVQENVLINPEPAWKVEFNFPEPEYDKLSSKDRILIQGADVCIETPETKRPISLVEELRELREEISILKRQLAAREEVFDSSSTSISVEDDYNRAMSILK